MRDRRAESTSGESEAVHEAEADPTGTEVALDDCDLCQVAFGVGDRLAVSYGRLFEEGLRDNLVGDEADHAGLDSPAPVDPEAVDADGTDPHRVLDPLRHLGARNLLDPAAALQHELGPEALELRQQQRVGLVAGGQRAQMVESVPERRVQGCEHQRVLGADPGCDGVPDHAVDVAVFGDVVGVLVVRAEGDPRGSELHDQGQERPQIPGHRSLPR